MNVDELLEAAARGDKAAVARLISLVERGGEQAREVVRRSPPTPGLYTVGITGAPGAGKSSLTDRLVRQARLSDALQVGVVAVDPSSLFSGGAILGDRVRMQGHALDDGVFIRSMATRGHLGGLALAVPDVLGILALAGVHIAFVETVGVGQVEVEVASATDTTVVVVNPRWGDAIQANKAGLMEIADIFVVNKADMPGARETVADLQQMLDLSGAGHHPAGGHGGAEPSAWRPPVVETVAATGDGVADLWAAVVDHQRHLDETGGLAERRRRRLEAELHRVLDARIAAEVAELARGDLAGVRQAVLAHEIDPYAAADRLLGEVGRRASTGRHVSVPEPPDR